MIIRIILALIGLISFPMVVNSSESTIILGVLEDNPGYYAGQPNFFAVRAVFQKIAGSWKAFPSDCRDQSCLTTITSNYPQEVTWTVAFDGRNLGHVTSRTSDKFAFYSGVGQQEITSTAPVPTIGKRSPEYGGFLYRPVYRP